MRLKNKITKTLQKTCLWRSISNVVFLFIKTNGVGAATRRALGSYAIMIQKSLKAPRVHIRGSGESAQLGVPPDERLLHLFQLLRELHQNQVGVMLLFLHYKIDRIPVLKTLSYKKLYIPKEFDQLTKLHRNG